jgi:hypothetical protein
MRAAHQIVAGDTRDISLGPWINSCFSYRMRKLGMPLVTLGAQAEFLVSEKEP